MRRNLFFIIFASIVLVSTAACSGYLDNQLNDMNSRAGFLALSDGSGYLSSDNYNEITPFLYRDPVNGRAWLFFSSDRPGGMGGYDIYYSEMDSSGKFGHPSAVTNSINTAGDETSPIVFNYVLGASPTTNIYISYMGKGKLNETIIMTYQLDSSFNLISGLLSSVTDMNAIYLGMQNYSGSLFPYMYISEGTTNIPEYSFSGTWVYFTTNHLASPVNSFNQFFSNIGPMIYITYTAFTTSANQLSGLKISSISNNNTTNFLDLSGFKTSADEITPFVDAGDNYKIYFASKRNGKGNYDLYRYNQDHWK